MSSAQNQLLNSFHDRRTAVMLQKLFGSALAIFGTRSNDNALAGQVGEFVTATIASGAAVSLVTATAKNVTSIALTPGDWDIDGTIDYLPAATTSITQLNSSVSLTTNTLGTQPGGSGLATDPTATQSMPAQVPGANVNALTSPSTRLSVAANTTVYLVAQATFTVSTLTAYGTLRARRVR